MSCLDVMYQVYGPPQPYFAAAYSPYHQKLAFYSKMQEAPESASSASTSSGSNSFSSHAPASIKEEDCSPEKERPPEAEYINSRCVLFTYFQGDISSVVDEHFSRALSQPSSFSGSRCSSLPSLLSPDGSFPMSQRSFPASFWNSAYQPSSVPASLSSSLGSPLAAAAHSELPFAAADPYSPAALHGHLHQGGPEPWHHPHPHPYLGAQGSRLPPPRRHARGLRRPLRPRYSSLLVPAASVRPHRLPPAAPRPRRQPQCELGKSRARHPAGDMAQGLGLNVDAARRYSFCGGSLLS
uniref:Vestigial like family member 2 n=1 Tax=Chelonoidis abingdonii TaxID=106734 RepID=A0A8C0GLK8_CHEAB